MNDLYTLTVTTNNGATYSFKSRDLNELIKQSGEYASARITDLSGETVYQFGEIAPEPSDEEPTVLELAA